MKTPDPARTGPSSIVDPRAQHVVVSHLGHTPENFHDVMAEQLRHAPWLMISVLLHAIALLILLQIRIDRPEKPQPATLTAAFPDDIDAIEPPEKEEKQIIPEVVDPVPELAETVIDSPEDKVSEIPNPDDAIADAPFDSISDNAAIGLGGNAGGPIGGGRKSRGHAPRPTLEVIDRGLGWLAKHQEKDGHWDCDEFMRHDPPNDLCDGAGNPIHDVGVTGLALLAFLGNDNTMSRGKYRDNVKRAALWLREQTDRDGIIGPESSHSHAYQQSIATLALVEAAGLSRSSVMTKTAQRAVDQLCKRRNPYGVWRYYARDGSNDSSVTGWMLFALKSAREFGMRVDDTAFRYTAAWFDEVTDPATGQCGYTKRGESSSRELGLAEKFPASKTEAMTAVGVLSRIFLGQTPQSHPVILAGADTMLKKAPTWNTNDGSIDLYYWYYGSYAMYQLGGRHWKRWKRSLEGALLKTQRGEGAAFGSWDPVGAWGHSGGRVYSTAIGTLCLQAYYRYSAIMR